ncbi:hypothetical protein AaE_013262 [Aphanomyces astaci]|uniref:Uncharacterized protein n=1 Tax=Aphanomyces astaci TaxID=112090 RepID=A0A6A4Z819_APHAT|nr:hypothetical protein AaE_013262 [Aphanomyces astaci]
MSFLQPQLRKDHVFDVHVDEKWFCVTKVKRTLYLYDDEVLAGRAAKSKKFITKVMFLAVVACPRYDPHKKKMFDGKIGICPFVEKGVAHKQESFERRPRAEGPERRRRSAPGHDHERGRASDPSQDAKGSVC